MNASGVSAEPSGVCERERGYRAAPIQKARSARALGGVTRATRLRSQRVQTVQRGIPVRGQLVVIGAGVQVLVHDLQLGPFALGA